MRLFSSDRRLSTRTLVPSSGFTTHSFSSPSRTTISSSWSFLLLLGLCLTVLTPSSFIPQVSAAAITSGFCGDCQTFATAISACGATFGPTDIEITGDYSPPQSASKCICTDVMQRVLWTCARCEKFAGFTTNTPPPQKYQTQCMAWGVTITDWKAPYTGPVAPGTSTTPLTSAGGGGGTTQPVNPGTGGTTSSVTSPTGGNGNVTSSGSSSVSPTSTDGAGAGAGPSSGPSGTAIGISLGIIGVAAMSGAIAVFMMKRSRRRRHEPLDLDGTYVGLDDQWEKPGRVQSPPMIPSPIASGAPVASRGPMQPGHRPSPFGSRPGGGGSVVGGYEPQYDQQYDQYDNKYDHPYVAPHHPPGPPGGGYDAYNHGSGYQGYAAHDYGYEHTVPTSGPFHGGKGGEGGQYL